MKRLGAPPGRLLGRLGGSVRRPALPDGVGNSLPSLGLIGTGLAAPNEPGLHFRLTRPEIAFFVFISLPS
jgi:hypothetical protein